MRCIYLDFFAFIHIHLRKACHEAYVHRVAYTEELAS